MYKAVFTDMDGTLLRNDHSISEATRDLLLRLVRNGIPVVLVSARPIHAILPISRWLGLEHMPIVSLNGGYIGLESEILFQFAIPLETVAELHQVSMSYEVNLLYYAGLEWFAEKSSWATTKEQKITEVPVHIASFTDLMALWTPQQTKINKIMAVGEPGVIRSLQQNLHELYGEQMNIYTSKPTYLEIMRHEASKTNGVKFLMNRFGLQREEIIAIGDNFNDKDMIAFAGMGIAMGNAPDEIKGVADYVTDTNMNDGLRKAFEKFIPLP